MTSGAFRFIVLVLLAEACGPTSGAVPSRPSAPPAPRSASTALVVPPDPREVHLTEIVQLTRGQGENAEAYWSSDGAELIFQSTRPGFACDQIFRMPASGGEARLVSTGKGRTTCGYFFPGSRRLLYSSTHLAGDECPPAPDRSQGYVWALYDSYDIFSARSDGSELMRLTDTPGYDAEATICPKDGSILFTSVRDGDLELYRMNADGSQVVRLTHAPGYDGGAFFSPDCSKIVWRASRPAPGRELEDYRALLAQGLVRPTRLEIWVANADGSDARQVTYLGAASFAPSFFPDGKRIIFSTNYPDPRGREFDLWAVDLDGSGLERITYASGFDGFPLFSPDGTRLVFSSNRNQAKEGETDVFVARWVDVPPRVEDTAAERFRRDVAWLADDQREGRGVGTRGIEHAALWIEERLRGLGLGGGLANGGFRHVFEVVVGVKAKTTEVTVDGQALGADQVAPGSISASGEATGDVVFAGYGIVAPELGIDDYKRVRAKGKIVVVRRFTPPTAQFEGEKLQRRYGDPRYKAFTARERGAKALVIVDAPEPQKDGSVPDEAPLPLLGVEPYGDVGIPVVFVRRAAGAPLLSGSHRATVKVALEKEKRPTWNVVAKIPAGAANRHPGAVVIGAHYDHLGRGGAASRAPGVDAIHNGADDNASGTAALLEAARLLAARRETLRRDVYVVAFSAEEAGVIGSTLLLREPPAGMEPSGLVAMLNLDMVGRLRNNQLSVLGAESAAEWPELVESVCARLGLQCSASGGGYGPSDHTPFYAAGVPVLHFFTGAHDQYHMPTDDTELVNAAGGARVAELVAELAGELAGREAKLTYRSAPTPEPAGDVRSYGASLGTVPDYAAAADGKPGVLLAGVRPGGPADLAGLRRGDRILRVGDSEVRTVEDLMFVLRNARPGQTTKIVFERDGRRREVEATFGQSMRR